MIKTKLCELPLNSSSMFGSLEKNNNLTELEEMLNQIGRENIISVTCSEVYRRNYAIYTVIYDDGT